LFTCILLAAFPGCGISNGGGTLDGDGYTLEIADGWEDTTEDAPSVDDLGIDDPALAEVSIDATITGGDEVDGFAPNLAIVTTPAAGKTDPVKLAAANLKTARAQGTLPPGAGGGAIDLSDSEVEDTELGGEPAAVYEQIASAPQGDVRQRQVYAINGDTAYALTYSGLDGGQYEDQLPAVEEMLGSWTWASPGS
jgi:hypothetical protein